MKTFAVIPTRNDGWILERVLATASLWADQIIVADENSWDSTQEICKKFPKVQLITFEPHGFNESNRRRVLLDTVRQWEGENLVFGLDSDEILTSEILEPGVKEKLLACMKPGMSAKLQWIMFWKNARQYRYDSLPEWSANYKHFVYWDDRKIKFDDVRMHSSRVPESATSASIIFNDIKVLHYAFAEWERMMAKHVYYLALEKTMGSKVHPYVLNRKYRWFYKTGPEGLVIKDLPLAWVSQYTKNGLNVLNSIPVEQIYWYDAEVLRFFKQYGLDFFRRLNIWNVDWNNKQKLASDKGEINIFSGTINNPQNWQDRIYYKYLQSIMDQGGLIDRLRDI